mmetsp:Transcript_67524/g.140738  ORF Transcript_67524/g.140738 Transcript_67524/m.140738 type:complete len:567 (-) Transcript_67524:91-1791(-)
MARGVDELLDLHIAHHKRAQYLGVVEAGREVAVVLEAVVLEHELVPVPRLEHGALLHLQVPLAPRQDLHGSAVPGALHEAGDEVGGGVRAVLLRDHLPQLLRPRLQLRVGKGGSEGGGERVSRELLHRQRCPRHPQILEVGSPEALFGDKGAGDRGDARLEHGPRPQRARAVRCQRTVRQQVLDRHAPIDDEDIGGEVGVRPVLVPRASDDATDAFLLLQPRHLSWGGGEALPLGDEEHAHARETRRLQAQRRQPLLLRACHASKGDEDRGGASGKKSRELVCWRPARQHRRHPEACEVYPTPPVRGLAEDQRRERMQNGEILVVEESEVAPAVIDALHAHPLLVPLAYRLAQGHPLSAEGDGVGDRVAPPEAPLPSPVRHVRPRLCGSLRGCHHPHERQLQTPRHCQPHHRCQRVAEDDVRHALDACQCCFLNQLEVVVQVDHLGQHEVAALTRHNHRRVLCGILLLGGVRIARTEAQSPGLDQPLVRMMRNEQHVMPGLLQARRDSKNWLDFIPVAIHDEGELEELLWPLLHCALGWLFGTAKGVIFSRHCSVGTLTSTEDLYL